MSNSSRVNGPGLVRIASGTPILDETRFGALVDDPILAPYRHFLATLRQSRPYRLTEPEERILALKDVSGREAFVQLYDELGASLRFQVDPDSAPLTEGEVIALLHHPVQIHDQFFTSHQALNALDIQHTNP